jgi:hypothetical protein
MTQYLFYYVIFYVGFIVGGLVGRSYLRDEYKKQGKV